MKKIFLMCFFLLGISAVSFAQGGGGRMGGNPEEQAKRLQAQLKLDDAQTAKIKAIYEVQAKKRDSLMTATNGDRQAMMQAWRPMMEASNVKIKEVLTADQKAAFEKWQAERASRMRQGGGNPPPAQK
ncbi:hypothetical protein [Mucilaginibacter aquatilis]|uniref:Periplasmic heavy metal sensor n=1 Tax=Mucilaginibacter aquatilis TaxID=1517760 RepID=A0A6I4ICQ7_9SPHI|nr:hypothetical protein [Mucilaginibacter aquatilis]MVN93080.1 hypothetical protein [Mucilaginibacter aquatilis]